MTFEEFIVTKQKLRNAWVREPGLSIYVRRPTGFTHNADFELASMKADIRGAGALTSFLEKNECSMSFYFENVLNDRLVPFLEKRGYRTVGAGSSELDVCMIAARCWHFRDSAYKPPPPLPRQS